MSDEKVEEKETTEIVEKVELSEDDSNSIHHGHGGRIHHDHGGKRSLDQA